MGSANPIQVNNSGPSRSPKAKAQRRGRPRAQASSRPGPNEQRDYPAAGTLTRTKSLLLAALRVWELKQRIRD